MEKLSERLRDVLYECADALSRVEEDIIKAALDRLAAYEATGLDPDQVKDMAADVAPVVHGRWEFDGSDFADIWKCSACGNDWYFEYDPREADTKVNYCPNCGARMDGE